MPTGSDLALPVTQVEELVRTMSKGLRAFQMYLPNNPVYQRAEQAIQHAFIPIWSSTRQILLAVVETDLVWEEQVVYHQPTKAESLAWMLYKDGMRFLTLRPGVEDEEMVRFLHLVTRARLLPSDAADDLLTLLWEQGFNFIDYQFAEIITESLPVLDPQAADMALRQDPAAKIAVNEEIKTDAADKLSAGFDLDDFDSTLYFLDEKETAQLKQEVDAEYTRDGRRAALEALLDIFELQPAAVVREEILTIFEALFPNLLNRGEFRTVAGLLREFRTVATRVTALDSVLRERILSFQARLSEPDILSQLLQSLEETEAMPTDEDIGEVLGELHSEGLETHPAGHPGHPRVLGRSPRHGPHRRGPRYPGPGRIFGAARRRRAVRATRTPGGGAAPGPDGHPPRRRGPARDGRSALQDRVGRRADRTGTGP
jgi:hypothetical protein